MFTKLTKMKTQIFLILILATLAYSRLSISIDTKNGDYQVQVDGTTWLSSGSLGFHTAGRWYTNKASLRWTGSSNSVGTDALGRFNMTVLNWSSGVTPFSIRFKEYIDLEVVVFEQDFPNGVPETATGKNSEVITAFPSFTVPESTDLFFYSYIGTFAYPVIGKFNDHLPVGVQAGPIVLYDNKLRSLVISPFSNFMVGIASFTEALGLNQLSFGLQGKILSIPTGFTHSVILSAGNGVTDSLYTWGSYLLKYYGKQRSTIKSDTIIQNLGYWTDNGAYYYYKTEPGLNYEQTMVGVYDYVQKLKVPVKNFQFDSWWYPKGVNGGVKLWEPMDNIFPSGMASVDKQIGGLPLALHNRYFSPDNDYIKMGYDFFVEEFCALPKTESLYTYIMQKAKSWGMVLYEQDWLVTTFLNMNATQNNVYNSRNWLVNMGNAARKLGLTIQYCMPLPNHLLQSVEIQSVTQSRASGDYNPSNANWKVGHHSLFLWSLGLIPFKDDFWTEESQPGCVFHTCEEPNTQLETISAVLTTGPVGPSDRIGQLNSTLVLSTCRVDGLLLKPDKPATPVEKVFLPQNDVLTVIELWNTYSEFPISTGNGPAVPVKFFYVVGADLPFPQTVYPKDLGLTDGDYIATNYVTRVPIRFSSTNPLTFPKQSFGTKMDFAYYTISDAIPNSSSPAWVLLGEVDKVVPVSSQRFSEISYTSAEKSSLKVTVQGVANERVLIGAYKVSGSQISLSQVACTVDGKGTAQVVCTTQCSCQ